MLKAAFCFNGVALFKLFSVGELSVGLLHVSHLGLIHRQHPQQLLLGVTIYRYLTGW